MKFNSNDWLPLTTHQDETLYINFNYISGLIDVPNSEFTGVSYCFPGSENIIYEVKQSVEAIFDRIEQLQK